jgi:hypothetical protein
MLNLGNDGRVVVVESLAHPDDVPHLTTKGRHAIHDNVGTKSLSRQYGHRQA